MSFREGDMGYECCRQIENRIARALEAVQVEGGRPFRQISKDVGVDE